MDWLNILNHYKMLLDGFKNAQWDDDDVRQQVASTMIKKTKEFFEKNYPNLIEVKKRPIFDKDDFPVDEWSDMVSGLGIDGLTCEVEDDAPLPCVKISVDWSPEDAGFVSDEMADASVESLKTWVQDVSVDSKVCPFTRSAEVAACVEIKILRRVRDDSSRRPQRHRRDACSMAWRCRFITTRRSQHGRVIAVK